MYSYDKIYNYGGFAFVCNNYVLKDKKYLNFDLFLSLNLALETSFVIPFKELGLMIRYLC